MNDRLIEDVSSFLFFKNEEGVVVVMVLYSYQLASRSSRCNSLCVMRIESIWLCWLIIYGDWFVWDTTTTFFMFLWSWRNYPLSRMARVCRFKFGRLDSLDHYPSIARPSPVQVRKFHRHRRNRLFCHVITTPCSMQQARKLVVLLRTSTSYR